MRETAQLTFIKVIHTLVWLLFNGVLFYLFYAVLVNRIDKWVWLGLGSFLLEGLVLLLFRGFCPLTVVARKYSDSTRDNFDIYLPNWLAKHNKTIYSMLLAVVVLMLIYRLISN